MFISHNSSCCELIWYSRRFHLEFLLGHFFQKFILELFHKSILRSSGVPFELSCGVPSGDLSVFFLRSISSGLFILSGFVYSHKLVGGTVHCCENCIRSVR